MVIPFNLHEGNRAEYLAFYALGALGFPSPVPRQSDQFGVDLIVHLARIIEKNVFPSGACFGIQIKLGEKDVEVKRNHFDTFYGLTIPFFLGFVSRDCLKLSVYSTLKRFCHCWTGSHGKRIVFAQRPDAKEIIPCRGQDDEDAVVPLGQPVLTVEIERLDDPQVRLEQRKRFYDVMEYWVALENRALSWKDQQVPLVEWPESHVTNEVPPPAIMRWCAASPSSFASICQAVQPPLESLAYYVQVVRQECPTPGPGSDLDGLERGINNVLTLCRRLSFQVGAGLMARQWNAGHKL